MLGIPGCTGGAFRGGPVPCLRTVGGPGAPAIAAGGGRRGDEACDVVPGLLPHFRPMKLRDTGLFFQGDSIRVKWSCTPGTYLYALGPGLTLGWPYI